MAWAQTRIFTTAYEFGHNNDNNHNHNTCCYNNNIIQIIVVYKIRIVSFMTCKITMCPNAVYCERDCIGIPTFGDIPIQIPVIISYYCLFLEL